MGALHLQQQERDRTGFHRSNSLAISRARISRRERVQSEVLYAALSPTVGSEIKCEACRHGGVMLRTTCWLEQRTAEKGTQAAARFPVRLKFQRTAGPLGPSISLPASPHTGTLTTTRQADTDHTPNGKAAVVIEPGNISCL